MQHEAKIELIKKYKFPIESIKQNKKKNSHNSGHNLAGQAT